ncbi:MAG: glycosyltransferase family 4 protein, partial [Pseudomonadota bacterium]
GPCQKRHLLRIADPPDLFAMPSRRVGDSVEGFGIVYLEAAACGTPSIAGRDGGASDAVLDGETGLLVDGNDPAAIALALETLLTAPEKRAAMGEAARRHAERQTWTQRAPDFLGLLRERD